MWGTWIPGMGVPQMLVVNGGLTAAFLGAGALLLVALWWARVGDGISVPRDRWPGSIRALATAGWLLWVGGMLVQLLGHFGMVGVATW
jgi:hypothetical protein